MRVFPQFFSGRPSPGATAGQLSSGLEAAAPQRERTAPSPGNPRPTTWSGAGEKERERERGERGRVSVSSQKLVKRVPNLSDDILNQSVDGEHDVGMDTKHFPTCVLKRCVVNIP